MKIPTHRTAPLLLTLLAVWSCSDQGTPTDPLAPAPASMGQNAPPRYGMGAIVMTRNLYLGTDISSLLALDPSNPSAFVQAVSLAHGEVVQSRPGERMNRIADEIAERRPDLVGLQEVTKLLVQSPGDFLQGNPQQASAVQFDFLQLLLEALAERSARYRVAATIDNVDIELPAVDPRLGQLYDVRMIDRDVILVREGVRYWNVGESNFTASLPVSIGSVQFPLYRGWTSVDARVHGRDVRFFNTHLETQAATVINELQALELLDIAAQSDLPVILAGDFNSAANASAPAHRRTQAYAAIRAAGYADAWAAAHPNDEGLTCCHPDDLLGPQPFDQRIDLVFYDGDFFGTGSVALLGVELSATTPSGRWPSDHAGLVAQVWLKDAGAKTGHSTPRDP